MALALPLIAAAALAALGVWCLVAARREPEPSIFLAGVGRVSPVTLFVGGLAAIGIAYHLVVHSLDLPHFRAPWWAALGTASGALLLSLLTDSIENRRDADTTHVKPTGDKDREPPCQ